MMNRGPSLQGPFETRQLLHVNTSVDREPNQGSPGGLCLGVAARNTTGSLNPRKPDCASCASNSLSSSIRYAISACASRVDKAGSESRRGTDLLADSRRTLGGHAMTRTLERRLAHATGETTA